MTDPDNKTAPLPTGLHLVQATCVLIGARAVLIRGAPGSGKSSLASALIARSGTQRLVRLVSDDGVLMRVAGGRLVAFAPEPTRGQIEMRGVGIAAIAFETRAVVALVVDLAAPDTVERLPDAADMAVEISGLSIPRITLPAGDPASVNRVLAAFAKCDKMSTRS